MCFSPPRVPRFQCPTTSTPFNSASDAFQLHPDVASYDGPSTLSAYFGDCPVYHVPGRVFPVDIAYASERPRSYLETAIETTWDLHRSQGPGDILLFLTGQEEIESACKRLNERVRDADETECDDAQILPLYAALPPEAQARVFCAPPRACRRIVVATNIAETSLTVPGVVFVVDPGVVKQNVYDPETGCDALKITAVSAVQARQRAGRAGRTQPGRCFRLYTRDAFEHDMPIVTVPEIQARSIQTFFTHRSISTVDRVPFQLTDEPFFGNASQRTSLVGVVLYLKMLRIKGLSVLDFDFLDKPDGAAMTDALRQLYVLGAIDVDGEITEMGREMSPLPVEPQLARAMLEARRRGVVEEMATVAAMLSVERVFVGGSGGGKGQGQGQGQGRDGRDRDRPPPIASADETKMGDHVVLLRTYEAWARGGHRRRFCEEHGLNDRGMEFARDVRKQLLGVFRDRDRDRDMDRGNGDRDGGNGDGDGGRGGKRDRDGVEKNQTQTQRRGDVTDLRKAICVGFANKLARRLPRHNGFRTFGADASMIAEAHPSVARSLADDVTGLLPEWVVFHSLVSTTRPFIKGVCRIEPEWAAQVMPRLGDVDVGRLSGGALAEERTGANAEKAAAAAAEAEAERTREASGRKNTDQAVEDARARYLARKNKAAAKKS